MTTSPEKIFSHYRRNQIDREETITLLISLLIHSKEEYSREKAFRFLEKIHPKNLQYFNLIENLYLTDLNSEIRSLALKRIIESFSEISSSLFNWGLNNDPLFENHLIIIKNLMREGSDTSRSILKEHILKVWKSIRTEKDITDIPFSMENIENQRLGLILINLIILQCLKTKFKNISYRVKNGFIIELDFSNISDSKTNCWRFREHIKNFSLFKGFKFLILLNQIKLFNEGHQAKNLNFFLFELELISTLKLLRGDNSKKILIKLIYSIKDEEFNRTIQNISINSSQTSTLLGNIYLNYLILMYIKGRYKNIEYTLTNGKIKSIKCKSIPLIRFPDYIYKLKSLEHLTIESCKIYSIHPNLGSLINLKELNLKDNEITELPETIAQLKKIKVLDLSGNNLTSIPSSIKLLENLEFLNLENNLISRLPESIGSLKKIKRLNLSKNKLKEIPKTIENLLSLRILNLSMNYLNELPEGISCLISLKKLILDHNSLKKIPNRIGDLNALKNISLGENLLTALPPSIKHLKELETLDLRWNRLKLFPKEFCFLESLKELILTHNEIKTLPSNIKLLKRLLYLDLTWNRLTALPHSIGSLLSLRSLILFGNQLKNLPASIGNLNNLKHFNLWGNDIKTIPNSIGRLKNLEELYLNGNKLKSLPRSFKNLKSLKKLSINNNRLSISPKVLKCLPNLTEFSNKHNK